MTAVLILTIVSTLIVVAVLIVLVVAIVRALRERSAQTVGDPALHSFGAGTRRSDRSDSGSSSVYGGDSSSGLTGPGHHGGLFDGGGHGHSGGDGGFDGGGSDGGGGGDAGGGGD